MAFQRKVSLNEDDARRVAAATLAYERGSRDMPGVRFRQAGGDEDPVRICRTSLLWPINTVGNLFPYTQGQPLSESFSGAATFQAYNRLGPVFPNRLCLVAKAENNSWYLIQSDMPPVINGVFTGAWGKNATRNVFADNAGSSVVEITAINRHASISGSGTRRCTVAWDGVTYTLIAAECQ